MPDLLEIFCSGNIIKNVKGVTVPQSGGRKGVPIAAALGAVGGDSDADLEVLSKITPEQREVACRFVERGACIYHLAEGTDRLYIDITARRGEDWARVVVTKHHTHICLIERNGSVLFEEKNIPKQENIAVQDKSFTNLWDIYDFVQHLNLEDVREPLERQIRMNSAISQEGLSTSYGAQVGKTLLKAFGSDMRYRACARAAAGSDARMGGCSLPVVINCGSGNQGMTVSLPVLEYAQALQATEEKLYAALSLSNLVSIHLKRFIGDLSAFCGAVTAAAGAGAAITFLNDGDYDAICRTIVNTLANVGGIICDGAKSSCAAKIASAVNAAILADEMSREGFTFQPGEGLVMENVEETVRCFGYVGRDGMHETDRCILNFMTGAMKP